MAIADLGPTQLKIIERPIRVYSLEVGQPATPAKLPEMAPEPRGAHGSGFWLLGSPRSL